MGAIGSGQEAGAGGAVMFSDDSLRQLSALAGAVRVS
jgi:hypothetical protein